MAKSSINEKSSPGDQNQKMVNYTPNLLALMPPEYEVKQFAQEIDEFRSLRTVETLELTQILNFCRLLYPSAGLLIISKVFKGKIQDLSETLRESEAVIVWLDFLNIRFR